jgi:hypothetical protein
MFGTTRGMLVPARKSLVALIFALIATGPIAARAADSGMVDVRTLPQLEGAVPVQKEHDQYPQLSLTYKVPGSLADTIAAVRKLLAADG